MDYARAARHCRGESGAATEQAAQGGNDHRMRAGSSVELAHQSLDMGLDRADADAEARTHDSARDFTRRLTEIAHRVAVARDAAAEKADSYQKTVIGPREKATGSGVQSIIARGV